MMVERKQKSRETESFEEILGHLFRYLKPLGFRKVRRTFYRVPTPGIVQIINLQKIGAFGPFTVNLGVFIEYVRSKLHPDYKSIAPNQVNQGVCHVDARIGKLCGRKDFWWELWDARPDKILADLMPLLSNEGLAFLDRFKSNELAEAECLRLAETRELGLFNPSPMTVAAIHAQRGDPEPAVKALIPTALDFDLCPFARSD